MARSDYQPNGGAGSGDRASRVAGAQQYDQYGQPLDDGFGYDPNQDDFVYGGYYAGSDGYEAPNAGYSSAGAYSDYQDQGYSYGPGSDPAQQGYNDAGYGTYGSDGYDYQYEGGGYDYQYDDALSGKRRMWGRRRATGAPEGQGGQRPGRQRGPRKRHRCLIVLLVVIAVLVGVYAVVFGPIDASIAFSQEESEGLSQDLGWTFPGTPYYVLVLGSDAREGDTVSRTDTMILARIDPLAGKVTMVSIPRDLKVELPGQGTQKINAAYAFGGASGAVEAVSREFGVTVSHVALVKFDGVSTLVDAIGGVDVDVPVAVNDPNYTGLVMDAGVQHMDGQTALLFSRARHGFALGDFQRQADQQVLIQAVVKKMLSSPSALGSALQVMGDVLSTDMKMYQIMPLGARLGLGSTVYSCSVPSEAQNIDGISYVVADDAEVKEFMGVVNSGQDPSSQPEGNAS